MNSAAYYEAASKWTRLVASGPLLRAAKRFKTEPPPLTVEVDPIIPPGTVTLPSGAAAPIQTRVKGPREVTPEMARPPP